MEDAVIAQPEGLLPLVTITRDSDMVTWNEAGDKVLLLSWHRYPESYPAGSTFLCEYGEVWTFTDREILSWYQGLEADVADWDTRLGYTYDWAEGGGEYGLSEFLISADSVVEVEWTVSTAEFVEMLQSGEMHP